MTGDLHTSKRWPQSVSWAVLAIYVAWVFLLKGLIAPHLPPAAVGLTDQLLLTCFFVSHALVYYSGQEVVFYGVVCAVIANVFENLSVLYGFPFGYYYHTALGGPRLFNVPYVVTLIYVAIGYVSWMVTQVILRRTRYADWKRMVFVAPLIAAFVFTAWDLCVDPVFGTIYKAFVYRNPGAWFGTPAGNYFGWMLTTYVFYLLFALFLKKRGDSARERRTQPGKSYWLQAILAYLMLAVVAILTDLTGVSADVTVADGTVWNTGKIYVALNLVTIFTMVFISLVALVALYQDQAPAN